MQATIVFADVASFTEFAESEGDEAAARVLERLDAAVRALTLEHQGKFVKQLGDGFMLVFRRSSDAVLFAIAFQGVIARSDDLPSVRIGINTGSVLHRAGDYVGSAVNIASRVTSVAMPDQILVTDTVVADARDTATRMESVGVRMLRGVDAPLALWRVVHGEEARDPVCGAEIVAAAAVRLRSGGRDLAFCSEDCLRAYIEDPSRYAAN